MDMFSEEVSWSNREKPVNTISHGIWKEVYLDVDDQSLMSTHDRHNKATNILFLYLYWLPSFEDFVILFTMR